MELNPNNPVVEAMNGVIPKNLTVRQIEALTRQDVLSFQDRKKEIVFTLSNGWKWHIEKA